MISFLRGQYEFLSNFYPAEFRTARGTRVKTVEHGFQAAKTFDTKEQKRILSAATPGLAKRLGQKVTLRPNWSTLKLSIMHNMVRMKFSQNAVLRKALLDTGKEKIEEGNTWGDTFWGVCRGKGKNHLGRILMEVRAELS